MHDAFWLSEEERQTRDLARAISRERVAPLAAQVDEAELYPGESLQHLAQAGLIGLYVPEAYGGAGWERWRSAARWRRSPGRAPPPR